MPFGDWLHAWRRRREFKSLAMRLLTYDDHQLDDMGYSRQDLLAAMNQPLRLDSQHLLARWRERRLEGKAARDHAAKSRRRPDHGGIQSNALLSGIGVGAVGVVGSTDYGRRGRSGS